VLPPFGVLSLESRVSPTRQLEPTDIAKFGSLDVAAYDLLAWEIIPSPCTLLKSASCPRSTAKVTERLLSGIFPRLHAPPHLNRLACMEDRGGKLAGTSISGGLQVITGATPI
jgi:hypothetical protein